ncbi:ubiquitin-like modifier-activating enzyme 6 [Antedon mediterranea]|uniref:ubiquitin-like modifier-activating enzyme 6 n=1 Tax=Antedon mediterranea TaxID=105859 RepID=UPI003AF7BD76
MASSADEIDDSLYSRQRYMLGDQAMKKMAHSHVFLSGLGGLGVEIAKNIVLAGVKSLTAHDTKSANWKDLSTQFFLKEADVKNGRNRAEASVASLSELNPNVDVKVSTENVSATSNLAFLSNYQCVILTETSLATQIQVNEFCRKQNPPIQFISGDVYGVFSYAFCDFGDEFEVADLNGEEAKQSFVASISKENPGVVTCLDNRMHKFDDGDYITFKEVNGMEKLNGEMHQIKVITPYAYSICDTSGNEYQPHTDGGIACQVKIPVKRKFESLAQQVLKPSVMMLDFLKDPNMDHLATIALLNFQDKHGRLPSVRDEDDACELVSIAKEVNTSLVNKQTLDTDAIKALAYSAEGCFSPLTAFLGGVIAQEVLKAVTSKYTPLDQWMFVDAQEVLPEPSSVPAQDFKQRGDRYDALRICIGETLLSKLGILNLFMVGCGAIGCEMLKNYALLGVGGRKGGKITITDNDLIEKSNLNRQFLFRPKHIQKPKSTTGAESAKNINPALTIVAHQNKVCQETEKEFFNDAFFESMDIVVNALDNVEARRYMDGRCVTNQRSLLESGTMGAKGHVQVIVANMTESYGSQQDPVDEDIPYCTLKSFPATIEHTIQWARDKFASFFSIKPTSFTKFWKDHGDAQTILKKLKSGEQPEGVIQAVKFLGYRPANWNECISTGRLKFQKYFNYKAQNLLRVFPRDSLLKDGTLFWQSPKRPPTPQVFDENNELHISFVISVARLCAFFSNIKVTDQDLQLPNVKSIIRLTNIPEFVGSVKKIVTDEEASKQEIDEAVEGSDGDEQLEKYQNQLATLIANNRAQPEHLTMTEVEFEKDDDRNGHIDFITSASNLRANMYGIENADRLKTKKIAGRIVPAIATTTAAVAGLATLELVKVVKEAPVEHYKNCFMNLGLPLIMFSEPGRPMETQIKPGMSYTIWDRWTVKGHKDYTLQDLTNHFKTKYDLELSMMVHGVRMVYVPIMPGHNKRLTQTMISLLKPSSDDAYFDLVIGFEPLEEDADEDLPAPPLRYYFGV